MSDSHTQQLNSAPNIAYVGILVLKEEFQCLNRDSIPQVRDFSAIRRFHCLSKSFKCCEQSYEYLGMISHCFAQFHWYPCILFHNENSIFTVYTLRYLPSILSKL